MTLSQKLAAAVLAVAAGAAYSQTQIPASEQNNRQSLSENANNVNANSFNTITNYPSPRARVIQETSVRKNGIFTDTLATSTIYEVEETEFAGTIEPTAFQKFITSDTGALTNTSVTFNKATSISLARKINTYLVSEICEGNMFYVKCSSNAVKVSSRPVTETTESAPSAP